jgi:hypothetical protein
MQMKASSDCISIPNTTFGSQGCVRRKYTLKLSDVVYFQDQNTSLSIVVGCDAT